PAPAASWTRSWTRASRRCGPAARCSPCTGGIRWPTTRAAATTCTASWPRAATWPCGSGTPRRTSTPGSTSGPATPWSRWPRPRAWYDQARAEAQHAGVRRARVQQASVIGAVGVVIPAHDEEDLLPSCLAAVRLAVAPLAGIAVHVVVVADACTDQTARLARAGGAAMLDISARSVGAARAAGVQEVLRRTAPLDPGSVWLATTDADTLVPPCWLTRQLRYAGGGCDAVVGTVTVTDWRAYPAELPPLFARLYGTAGTDAAGSTGHP